jgi:hypothetical protein
MQETKQKKKLKKSYAELLEEFGNTQKRIAVVYIPQLCDALKEENPEMSFAEIKRKVVDDAVLQGWNEGHIIRCLPSWLIEDDPNHKRVKKNWETRHANVLKSSSEMFEKITRNIPELPQQKEREPSEEVDQQMHELGIAKFGESDKSIREIKGDITEAAAQLFKALTQKDDMPDESEDLIVDYIKPTREFRRSLSLELDETSRTTIYNWLHYTSAAIEDMLNIIKESK